MRWLLLFLVYMLPGYAGLFAAGSGTNQGDIPANQVRLQNQGPAERFRTLLEEGYAHLQTRQYGRAALAFEKALVITDAFPPLRQNLRELRKFTGADRHEIRVHPLVEAIFFLYYSCTPADLARILVILAALTAIVAGLMVFRRWTGLLLMRLLAATLCVFLFASVLALMYHHRETVAPDRGVILEEAGLFARLGKGEVPVVRLPQATAVRVLQRGNGMVRVSLPGGAAGWVDARVVGIVNE